MNITNEFVTVEFNTEKEEKIARRCIKLLESQKELYKGLLNGKNLISCEGIYNKFDDFDKAAKELSDIRFKYYVDSYIEEENSAKEGIMIPEYDPESLYDIIVFVIQNDFETELAADLYLDLASNYYYLTKDFSYLKNFIYHDKYSEEDINDMVLTLVREYYSVLLREKVSLDMHKFSDFLEDYNTSIGLISIISQIDDETMDKSELVEEYLAKENNEELISSITDEEFDTLVKGALSYIDSSNSLLEEYIKCKEEDRICEDSHSYFYWNPDDSNDYKIGLHKEGNIRDVIVFVHEFAHLHYAMIDIKKKENIGIFKEYPSIYYELKTAEYLCSKGYSEEEVESAEMFRLIDNYEIGEYLPSELTCIYENKNKDKNNYDLSWLKFLSDNDEFLENRLKEIYSKLSEDEIEAMIEDIKEQSKLRMLLPFEDTWKTVPYIIGTFFAQDAILYYTNEEVLEILDEIQLNEHDLYDVLKMHDFEPESIGMTKEEKDKANQKVYKI